MTAHFSGAHGPRDDDKAAGIPVSRTSGTIYDRAALVTGPIDPLDSVAKAQSERKNMSGHSRPADRFVKPASFR